MISTYGDHLSLRQVAQLNKVSIAIIDENSPIASSPPAKGRRLGVHCKTAGCFTLVHRPPIVNSLSSRPSGVRESDHSQTRMADLSIKQNVVGTYCCFTRCYPSFSRKSDLQFSGCRPRHVGGFGACVRSVGREYRVEVRDDRLFRNAASLEDLQREIEEHWPAWCDSGFSQVHVRAEKYNLTFEPKMQWAEAAVTIHFDHLGQWMQELLPEVEQVAQALVDACGLAKALKPGERFFQVAGFDITCFNPCHACHDTTIAQLFVCVSRFQTQGS